MYIKFFSLLMVFVFLFNTLVAQKASAIKWVFPMQKGIVSVGMASDGFAAVSGNNNLQLISSNGASQTLPYDSATYAFGQCWYVWKAGLMGVYKLDEGELVPAVYHNVQAIEKRAANWAYSVQKYGMFALVDAKNHLILPYQKHEYARMSYVSDTILAYLKHDLYNPSQGNFSHLSRSGRKVPFEEVKPQLPVEFQRISADQYVLSNYQKGAVRSDTFSMAEKFVDDVAVVQRKNLWGFVRRNGTWVIQPRFQAAHPFDADGNAVVKSDGKYGVVKKDGTYLLKPQFEFLKPFAPGLYELKENANIGLVNETGKTVLPPGKFGGIQLAGTGAFAVKSGDSLLLFRRDGTPLQNGKVTEVSRDQFDETFAIKQISSGKHLRGVFSSEGLWRIPAVIKGRITEHRNFIIVEADTDPCCMIGSYNLGINRPGKFLVYNRNGELMLKDPVDALINKPDLPFLIYKTNNKFGLIIDKNEQIPAEYDGIQVLGNGWLEMRKDGLTGLVLIKV